MFAIYNNGNFEGFCRNKEDDDFLDSMISNLGWNEEDVELVKFDEADFELAMSHASSSDPSEYIAINANKEIELRKVTSPEVFEDEIIGYESEEAEQAYDSHELSQIALNVEHRDGLEEGEEYDHLNFPWPTLRVKKVKVSDIESDLVSKKSSQAFDHAAKIATEKARRK